MVNRIAATRAALIIKYPFWGLLARRLRLEESTKIDSMATDGTRLLYNPSFVSKLKDDELAAVIVHEVCHCILEHPWRMQGKNHRLANIACDYAVNWWIKKSGFVLPHGALISEKWANWSAERIYDALLKEMDNMDAHQQSGCATAQSEGRSGDTGANQQQGDGRSGDTGANQQSGRATDQSEGRSGDSGDNSREEALNKRISEAFGSGPIVGEVLPAQEEGATENKQDWRAAVVAAAQAAKQQGKLPAGIERLVSEVAKAKVDWRSALKLFVDTFARDDYSWERPAKRYAAHGLYLPALHSKSPGEVVLAIDTSGSTWDMQSRFFAEASEMLASTRIERLHVLHCDAEVQHYEQITPGDALSVKPKGGGGTSFVPVFEEVEKRGISPTCLIYLTDCYGTYPSQEPDYPVLWASTTDPSNLPDTYLPPFGETIYIGH